MMTDKQVRQAGRRGFQARPKPCAVGVFTGQARLSAWRERGGRGREGEIERERAIDNEKESARERGRNGVIYIIYILRERGRDGARGEGEGGRKGARGREGEGER